MEITEEDKILISLSEQAQSSMVARGWSLGTAESCTGGLLGFALTSTPGCSRFYLGGMIAYSNDIKTEHLKVPRLVIEENGAVSSVVASMMCQGVRDWAKSDAAISLTGIAGPGGSPGQDKPVGTVWCGICTPEKNLTTLMSLSGARRDIQIGAVIGSLEALLSCL